MNKTYQKIKEILKNGNIEEFEQEAKYLITSINSISIEEILLKGELDNEDELIELAKKRVSSRAPIQHIVGFAYFMGEKYIVNEDVLIPRDETEILVNSAYELLKDKKEKLDILDIGVGSGCISCALAKKLKNKEIEILGVDISSKAIMTALENVNKLDLVRKIILRKSDLFSKIRDCEKFDLIISNPPYIPKKEKENLQKEVLFDPELALFTSDDEGVEFYQKIINKAPQYLKKEGIVAFELGINQSDLVHKMLEKDFSNIKIIKDLANIDRVILAQLKG